MADRPILFSAPMVRALLEGRKTQTRRILKPQPVQGYAGDTPYFSWNGFTGLWPDDWHIAVERNVKIAVSDRLWVRENVTRFDKGTCDQHIWYRAGLNFLDTPADFYLRRFMTDGDAPWPKDKEGPGGGAAYNVPSIHMPRWASRVTLIVTDVRVMRLKDCSVADACAEGALVPPYTEQFANVHALPMYRAIWEGISGEGSWEANPWVAAYTFRVIRDNIDWIEERAA